MNINNETTRCTCGPYPTIDLTSAFSAIDHTKTCNFTSTSKHRRCPDKFSERRQQLQEEVKEACEAFGCFHITINTAQTSEGCATTNTATASFRDLVSEEKVIKTIESLFADSFLSLVKEEYVSEGNADGSVLSVSFPNGIPDVDNNGEGDNAEGRCVAKYRGRSAESGSAESSQRIGEEAEGLLDRGEPKQSWEFFRCRDMLRSETSLKKGYSKEKDNALRRLQILQTYTNILHSVAEMIFSPLLLDLPQHTFLAPSSCPHTHNDNVTSPKISSPDQPQHQDSTATSESTTCCSMDLLRVFRYDALDTPELRASHLGSSPHTDWGSLTVVWQDSIGGLQIYCHKHDRWNDVTVEKPSSMNDDHGGRNDVGDDTDTGIVRLFIHVGDFLSLAMSGASKDGNKLHSGTDVVRYPSPMHRVVCPGPRVDENDGESIRDADDGVDVGEGGNSSASRCSLVYFVYPPPGLSIRSAQSSLFYNDSLGLRLDTTGVVDGDVTPESSDKCCTGTRNQFPFDRYMLLNDQSTTESVGDGTVKGDRRVFDYYNRIHSLPFDAVIHDKWSQVQR